MSTSNKDPQSVPSTLSSASSAWTFLSNHAHVLVCLARDPQTRLRDVAEEVGITERAVQRIVRELETAGVLKRSRLGRRNRYEIVADISLRHALERHCTIGELLDVLLLRKD